MQHDSIRVEDKVFAVGIFGTDMRHDGFHLRRQLQHLDLRVLWGWVSWEQIAWKKSILNHLRERGGLNEHAIYLGHDALCKGVGEARRHGRIKWAQKKMKFKIRVQTSTFSAFACGLLWRSKTKLFQTVFKTGMHTESRKKKKMSKSSAACENVQVAVRIQFRLIFLSVLTSWLYIFGVQTVDYQSDLESCCSYRFNLYDSICNQQRGCRAACRQREITWRQSPSG